jgi:hypothetical protein
MNDNKTWIILPVLIFTKYKNGKKEVIIGWLNKTYSITYGGKQ